MQQNPTGDSKLNWACVSVPKGITMIRNCINRYMGHGSVRVQRFKCTVIELGTHVKRAQNCKADFNKCNTGKGKN